MIYFENVKQFAEDITSLFINIFIYIEVIAVHHTGFDN